jgi:hypothetical protein
LVAGRYGYVRYSMEVTIKRGLFKFDHDLKVPVIINTILDLNKEAYADVSTVHRDHSAHTHTHTHTHAERERERANMF